MQELSSDYGHYAATFLFLVDKNPRALMSTAILRACLACALPFSRLQH